MKAQQSGFTLIELVVVIVLLGILGVAASAKFIDLTTEAADAAEQGVAGELSSAAAINYAAQVLGSGGTAIAGAGQDCSTLAPNLLTQIPAGFTAAEGGSIAGTHDCTGAGDTFTCTVTHGDGSGTNATATIVCTG